MLEKMMQELVAAVGKLPGGKFKLKLEKQGHATNGIDFLGHNLAAMSGGGIRISPNQQGINSIYALANLAAQRLASALSCGDKEKAVKHCGPVKGWLASFSACDDILELEKSLIVGIAQNACLPVELVRELMQSAKGEYEYLADENQYS